jgi:hypothetical protein
MEGSSELGVRRRRQNRMRTTASTTLDYIPEPIRAFVARRSRGSRLDRRGGRNHLGSGILVGRRSELQSCGVRSGAQFARSARGDCRRSHHAIARAVFHRLPCAANPMGLETSCPPVPRTFDGPAYALAGVQPVFGGTCGHAAVDLK